MARQVAWTETAWEDLDAAASYIARDSPAYAAVFVQEVRGAARSHADLSLRGRVVPALGDPGIRELIVGSFRLIYRVSKGKVNVLGLVHGARDLWALWMREDRGASSAPP